MFSILVPEVDTDKPALMSSQTSKGIVPFILLLSFKCTDVKFESIPISDGMVPLRSLL